MGGGTGDGIPQLEVTRDGESLVTFQYDPGTGTFNAPPSFRCR